MLLGLTGGIATGKSTFVRLLAAHGQFTIFDADACVHELLASDEDVIAAVRREFRLAGSGGIEAKDRARLRHAIFSDPDKRRRLEAILHPAVRQRWMELLQSCRGEKRRFLADIPLLFETGAGSHFDATVLIAASSATQRLRMGQRDLSPELIDDMLASQWPVGQKIPLADYVVWNDGSLAALEKQTSLLLSQLESLAA